MNVERFPVTRCLKWGYYCFLLIPFIFLSCRESQPSGELEVSIPESSLKTGELPPLSQTDSSLTDLAVSEQHTSVLAVDSNSNVPQGKEEPPLTVDEPAILPIDPKADSNPPLDEAESSTSGSLSPSPAAQVPDEGLKRTIEEHQQQLQEAKGKAEKVDAQWVAVEIYQAASQEEQKANDLVSLGTVEGLQTAQSHYAAAQKLYDKAFESALASKQTAIQKEAVEAQQSMEAHKEELGTNESLLNTLPAYQTAIKYQNEGNKYYDTGDYPNATSAFLKAQQQFRAAKAQLADKVAIQTNKQPQKENVRSVIQRQIEEYGLLLERKDLDGLRAKNYISQADERAWSKLFEHVKNLKVKIADTQITILDDTADANFRVSMTYFNTSNNEIKQNNFSLTWNLEQVGKKWVIAH